MERPPRQTDQSGNTGAGAAERPMTKAEAAKAMSRFKVLTGRLLTVSRDQLAAEEKRYQDRKPRKRSVKAPRRRSS
jgi:hypothetical protein